jgi:hypothetical protein
VRNDPGHVAQRFDVVDHRRSLVEAPHREARRAVARVALLALEGTDEAGCLACDVRAGTAVHDDVAAKTGAADSLAEPAGRIGLLDCGGHAAIRQIELAANVNEAMPRLDRVGRQQHSLQQQVWRLFEDPTILERAGLALVRIRDQMVRLAVPRNDDRPFATRRECRAAAAL